MKAVKLLKALGDTNAGHGHVYVRPDSVLMRCGGPGMCAACSKDMEQLQTELAPPSSPQATVGPDHG